MISYRFNLLALGYSKSQYRTVASNALGAARRASAIDTGNFRKGWIVRLVGDFLFVENNIRYAAPVELGSIVHRKHQYEIRDALSRIGLTTGITRVGSVPIERFDSRTRQVEERPVARPTETQTQEVPASTRSGTAVTPRSVGSFQLTEAEIRSPALIRNKFTNVRTTDLFKRATLIALLLESSQRQEATNEQTN